MAFAILAVELRECVVIGYHDFDVSFDNKNFSAAMDRVTESLLAIELAKQGGIGNSLSFAKFSFVSRFFIKMTKF